MFDDVCNQDYGSDFISSLGKELNDF